MEIETFANDLIDIYQILTVYILESNKNIELNVNEMNVDATDKDYLPTSSLFDNILSFHAIVRLNK